MALEDGGKGNGGELEHTWERRVSSGTHSSVERNALVTTRPDLMTKRGRISAAKEKQLEVELKHEPFLGIAMRSIKGISVFLPTCRSSLTSDSIGASAIQALLASRFAGPYVPR